MNPDDFLKKEESFSFIETEHYTIVKLTGFPQLEESRQFEEASKKLFENPVRHVIFHCEALEALSKTWIRLLLQIKTNLQKSSKQVRMILTSPSVRQFIHDEGLKEILLCCPNLREAQIQLGLASRKMLDADFLNPFLASTIRALKIQASTDARPGKPTIRPTTEKMSGDISGVINLSSETFNGSIVLSFPEATFLKIISKMIGEEVKELTKDVSDGAGELTNIIFGQAKVLLNDRGYGLKTAIPSVIVGKNHTVTTMTKGPVLAVPFTSDAGDFAVEICISD